MCEATPDEAMIVPTTIDPVRPRLNRLKYVNYYIRNGEVLERVEADERTAVRYYGNTDRVKDTVEAGFEEPMIDAVYVEFGRDKRETFLCLVSQTMIDCYRLRDNQFIGLDLTMTIRAAHVAPFGLIVEKLPQFSFSKIETPHLFAVMHPYADMIPLLTKLKDEDQCHFAFFRRHLRMVPSNFGQPAEFFLAYDEDKHVNCVFWLRRCVKAEIEDAKKDLTHATNAIILATPTSACSYSPGFVLKRRPDAAQARHFLSEDKTDGTDPSSFGAMFPAARRPTAPPLRRSTRMQAMVAAAFKLRPVSNPSQGPVEDRYCPRHYQQDQQPPPNHVPDYLRPVSPPPASWMSWNSQTSRANKPEKFVLPKLDYILECIWMEPRAGADADDVAVGSLSADRVQSDVASKARSSKGTKPRTSVSADATTGLQVSRPSTSAVKRTIRRPFEGKYPTEADFFFHTTDLVGQKFAAFYNKTEKSLTLLRISPLSGPPQTYIVPGVPTVVKCRDAVPIYNSNFFVVLDASDNAVSLYTGAHRLGPVTLASTTAAGERIQVTAQIKRLRTSGCKGFSAVVKHVVGQSEPCVISSVSSKDRERLDSSHHSSENLDEAELQLINGIVGDIPSEDSVFLDDFRVPETSEAPPNSAARSRVSAEKSKKLAASVSETLSIDIPPPGAKLRTGCIRFKCALNLGHVTRMGRRCLTAAYESLSREKPMQFFAAWLHSNAWRVLEQAAHNLEEVELAMIFEHFFRSAGIDATECPFYAQVKRIKDRMAADRPEEIKRLKVDAALRPSTSTSDAEEQPVGESLMARLRPAGRRAVTIRRASREDFLQNNAFSAFATFHGFYESLKLKHRARHNLIELVVEPLFVFVSIFGLEQYKNLYLRDFPVLSLLEITVEDDVSLAEPTNTRNFHLDRVPSVNCLMDQLASADPHALGHLPSSTHYPTRAVTCFAMALSKVTTTSQLAKLLGKNCVKRLGIWSAKREKRLLEILAMETSGMKKCQELTKLLRLKKRDYSFLNVTLMSIFAELMDEEITRAFKRQVVKNLRIFPPAEQTAKWTRQRWPTDIRLVNVRQMLDSSLPVLVPIKALQTLSETVIREQQEQFLLVTALKTVTRPFGRAMLHFGTEYPVPSVAWKTPAICLNGRINPGNLQIDYPVQENNAAHRNVMDWANFYNGIASGLAYAGVDHFMRDAARPPDVDPPHLNSGSAFQNDPVDHSSEDGQPQFDWGWISVDMENMEPTTPAQAGVVLAAGLTGYAKLLNMYDLHEHVSRSDNKFMVMALLLGGAVSRCGTSDVTTYKLITTHLPFLMQPTLVELKIDPGIQIAGLVSLGYVFAQTCQPYLTNELINQMAKETFFDTDPVSERYSSALAAGFAVGLINLGRGPTMEGLTMPVQQPFQSVTARLMTLLNGGSRSLCVVHYDEPICPFNTTNAQQANDANTSTTAPASSQQSTNANTSGAAATPSGASASCHIRELEDVNLHLTSPAASAALGLIYLRTGHKWVIEALSIPNTLADIDKIRPDVLMIRTVARCLVDYENIGSTLQWVEAQVPEVIRNYVEKMLNTNMRRGAEPQWWTSIVDVQLLSQAFLYISAGACLAMALRHASSWNPSALKALTHFYEILQPENKLASKWARLCAKAGKNTVSACLSVSISSLALLMAGSGDLRMIQIVRKMRNYRPRYSSLHKDTNLHSAHVTANMALGMLNIGQGRWSLGQSNLSVASLFIAFFPVFPHSVTDNRVYFQPLRFLWTVAAQHRHLTTIDAKTMHSVEANVDVTFWDENERPVQLRTPCILPPLHRVTTIEIQCTDFKRVELHLDREHDLNKLKNVLNQLYGCLPLASGASRPIVDLQDADPEPSDADFEGLEPPEPSEFEGPLLSRDVRRYLEQMGAEESPSRPSKKHARVEPPATSPEVEEHDVEAECRLAVAEFLRTCSVAPMSTSFRHFAKDCLDGCSSSTLCMREIKQLKDLCTRSPPILNVLDRETVCLLHDYVQLKLGKEGSTAQARTYADGGYDKKRELPKCVADYLQFYRLSIGAD